MKVWSIPHTRFAALNLVNQLVEMGHDCSMVDRVDPGSNELHIIYGAHACPSVPKNYIVYQTEIRGSHHFDRRYKKIIAGALAVWEYNRENQKAYYHDRVSIVPPGVFAQPRIVKDISVLFYGWIAGSDRRAKMIDSLREHMDIRVVVNVLGREMWCLLQRARVVVNIHYYHNSPFEYFRIAECLSHHCHVVSEKPEVGEYSGPVRFVGGLREMIEDVEYLSGVEFDYPLDEFNNRAAVEQALSLVLP